MHTKLKESIASLQKQIDFERKCLRDRRERIHNEHERHKQLIENTETLINIGCKYREMYSENANWKLRKTPQVYSHTPGLILLREKLAIVRCRTSDAKCT